MVAPRGGWTRSAAACSPRGAHIVSGRWHQARKGSVVRCCCGPDGPTGGKALWWGGQLSTVLVGTPVQGLVFGETEAGSWGSLIPANGSMLKL